LYKVFIQLVTSHFPLSITSKQHIADSNNFSSPKGVNVFNHHKE